MMITDKINFKQPKYVLPAILYPLLLISGYLIFDIFDTEPARTENALGVAGVLFCFRPVVPANERTGTKDPLCGSSIN